MSSSWRAEIAAVFRKEMQQELRSKSGLATVGLFSLSAVVAIAFATFNQRIDRNIASGLLWVSILFAAITALPRTFVTEEEQGTADLLRLIARPEAVFWGKALYNLVLMVAVGFILSVLFFGFTSVKLSIPWLYAVCLFGGCAALSGAVTLCGALVAQAANRAALAGAIAVPLLLPLMALGVAGMRVAIGPVETDLVYQGGVKAAVGLVAYAAGTLAIGPPLFASVWKN